jgi:hypothetical protein
MPNLHHFYHVYADGDWEMCVPNHIRALTEYGLYEKLTSFNVGFVGKTENIQKILDYLDQTKVKYNVIASSPTGFEQETLDPLWEAAKSMENDYILYAHTKGSAFYNPVNNPWRHGMTRKLVVEWERCIKTLNMGYSTVGCHFYRINPDNPNPFWGGNFWWINSEHVKALEKVSREHRHCAEAWIGSVHDQNVFKPFDIFPVAIGALTEPY